MDIAYSLAGSYLLLGTAIGLVTWYTFAQLFSSHESNQWGDKVLKIAIVLAGLGVILAILHLGRMERFFNLIANPHSWLSREGLCAGAFTGGIMLYYLLVRNKWQEAGKYRLLLYAVVTAGLATFISMGMIYASAHAIPAWNTTLVVLVNIFSGLLLGGLLFLVLVKDNLSVPVFKTLTISLLIVSVVSIMINVAYEAHISMALTSLALQGVAVPSVWLGTLVRVIVGLLVPAYLIIKLMSDQSAKAATYLSITLACVIVGEITAKLMHFIVGVKAPFL